VEQELVQDGMLVEEVQVVTEKVEHLNVILGQLVH
jgi:hypothetical protein